MKKIYELDEVSENLVLPDKIKDTIDNFVWYGRPVGHFVEAVLSNNLFETIGRADDNSLACIKDICTYVYCAVPTVCYGDITRIRYHIRKGRELHEQTN